MKKVCVSFPIGCPRSMMDAALLIDYFMKNGWEVTNRFKEADMVLISSCGFTEDQENKSMGFLSAVARKKREVAPLIAFGCLPGINERRLRQELDVIPLTRGTLSKLDSMIGATVGISDIDQPNDVALYFKQLTKCFSDVEKHLVASNLKFSIKSLPHILGKIRLRHLFSLLSPARLSPDNYLDDYATLDGRRIYNLRVATGCMESCSYCAIRFAAGDLRSTPLHSVLKDFDGGLDAGYTMFRLVGEDVGAYGQDIGVNIVQLLREMFERHNRFHLMFDDFHPKWFIQYFSDLNEILSRNQNRIRHVGLPVQSGSDRMLKLMRRDYSAAELLDAIRALRSVSPGLRVHTHFLIGFPGEEERDVVATIRFLESAQFQVATVYKYSDRPNTEASGLPGKVSEDLKVQRVKRVKELLN